jgi:hypothetical protein
MELVDAAPSNEGLIGGFCVCRRPSLGHRPNGLLPDVAARVAPGQRERRIALCESGARAVDGTAFLEKAK